MKQGLFCLFILIAIVLNSADATIRRVGLNQTYTTLTAAYTAAVNDDTLLISPGVYSETITSTKRLTWLGAGYDEVTINGRMILNAGSSGTRIEGIQIMAASDATGVVNLAAGVDFVEFRRCHIYQMVASGNSEGECIKRNASPGGSISTVDCILRIHGVYYGGRSLQLNGDAVTARNCLFAGLSGNGSSYAIHGTPQSIDMTNCVFVGMGAVSGASSSFPFSVRNCIAHDWDGAGSWGSAITSAAFNASSAIAPPGTDGILLAGDPFANYNEAANFVYGVSDLHLAAGSPCIDAGDPAILDLDGSRSDMGIYGGQTPHVDGGAPNYPFAIDLTIPSNMSAGQQLPIQATGRIGAGY